MLGSRFLTAEPGGDDLPLDQPDAALERLQAAGINVVGSVDVYNRVQ
jgi:hypothetical protein